MVEPMTGPAQRKRILTHLEGMQLIMLTKVALGVDTQRAEELVEWYGGGIAAMALARVK